MSTSQKSQKYRFYDLTNVQISYMINDIHINYTNFHKTIVKMNYIQIKLKKVLFILTSFQFI